MRRRFPRKRLCLIVIGLVFASLGAHVFELTDVEMRLGDGRFEVDLTCDLDALALGVSPQTAAAQVVDRIGSLSIQEFEDNLARLERTLARRVRVRFDGQPADLDVRFPQLRPDRRPRQDSVIGTRVTFSGAIPEGAQTVSFFASRAFPPVRLSVTGSAGRSMGAWVLQRAEPSPALSLGAAGSDPALSETVARYLRLGFTHILPHGLDHVLFVVGLFLLCSGLRPLLWQVTAFTVAHTITLGLAIYGYVSLPERPVEALIAASIVYIALENLRSREVSRFRVLAIFLFGLLHGIGFAGAISALGFSPNHKALSLLFFNIGVELGQLSVLAIALLTLGWWRGSQVFYRRVTVPGSVLIGITGLVWLVERL